jgi:hypothetical protein
VHECREIWLLAGVSGLGGTGNPKMAFMVFFDIIGTTTPIAPSLRGKRLNGAVVLAAE